MPKRKVETQRAGVDRLDFDDLAFVAQLHHRALAEGPIDLGQRGLQSPLLVTFFFSHQPQRHVAHFRSRHIYPMIPPRRAVLK